MTVITTGIKPVAIRATVVEKLGQMNDQVINATNVARTPFIGASKNLDDSSSFVFIFFLSVKSLVESPHVIAPNNGTEDR